MQFSSHSFFNWRHHTYGLYHWKDSHTRHINTRACRPFPFGSTRSTSSCTWISYTSMVLLGGLALRSFFAGTLGSFSFRSCFCRGFACWFVTGWCFRCFGSRCTSINGCKTFLTVSKHSTSTDISTSHTYRKSVSTHSRTATTTSCKYLNRVTIAAEHFSTSTKYAIAVHNENNANICLLYAYASAAIYLFWIIDVVGN